MVLLGEMRGPFVHTLPHDDQLLKDLTVRQDGGLERITSSEPKLIGVKDVITGPC